MQKAYFDPEDFEQLFEIDGSDKTKAPQVSESLSGLAQHLKSADQSVTYKNFNEDHIEETTLVGDSHQQQVVADWIVEHSDGVTTDWVETAPSINQHIHLKNGYTQSHQTLNEVVTTQNEARNIEMTQWEVFHEALHTEIPTQLQQTIQTSGSTLVETQESLIGTQNIVSDRYFHQFGTLNLAGPVTVSGNRFNLSGQKIIIGGPSPEQKKLLMPKGYYDQPNYYFNTAADFELAPYNLPPYETAEYSMTGTMNISGHYAANNKEAAGPLPSMPKQPELEAHLKEVIANYFMNLEITATNEEGHLNIAPSITVGNQQGDYTFENAVMVNRVAPFISEFSYNKKTSVHKPSFESWEFDFSLSMALVVTVTSKNKFDPNFGSLKGMLTRVGSAAEGSSETTAAYHAMVRSIVIRLATQLCELVLAE